MTWVLAVGVAWLVVAVLVGVVVGRGIRLADRREASTAALEAASPNFVVDIDPLTAGPAATGAVAPAPRPPAEQTSDRQRGLA